MSQSTARDIAPGASRDARVVVLLSGAGSNFATLADSDLGHAKIVAVVSDRDDAAGLQLARDRGIATAIVSPGDFVAASGLPDRLAWDTALSKAVRLFAPDLVVSAGFMRILGSAFLAEFGGRTINSHPALLPAFPGAHAVRDALAAGVSETGVTVHLVDAGVDTGPILVQANVPVLPHDDVAILHERIKVIERQLLARTVAQMLREGWSVVVGDGPRAVFGCLDDVADSIATYFPPLVPGARPSRSRVARPQP